MNFLPDNYEAPKTTNYYFKLQDGENKIRILSKPIIGWEDWDNNKPVRFTLDNKPTFSIDPDKPVKHFWAFIVYNYCENEIQVMQVTQATIRNAIEALCKDTDWGAPFFYDIKIHKTGEKVNTKYTVNPTPHKPLEPYITKAFYARRCCLEAMFQNLDPFALDYKHYTELASSENIIEKPSNGIAQKDLDELTDMFEKCDPVYKKELLDSLKNMPTPVQSIKDIPATLYDRIKKAIQINYNKYQALMNQQQLFEVF
jgi:hypothetical protein